MSKVMTAGDLARHLGAELDGDAERVIRGAAPLGSAGPEDLSFLARRKYLPYLASTRAGAVIVSRNLEGLEEIPRDKTLLWMDDAHLGLARALAVLYPEEKREANIAPSALLGPGVELGKEVSIGAYSVVGAGVRLGDGVKLGAHCVIGERCRIGAGSELKDQVMVYPDTEIGARCIVHSGCRLGVDGFGYVFAENEHRKIPQVGRCVIEDGVEIGANTCVDRGSVGETRIGAGTKIDNLVHIAHNVRVGRNCIIVAQVGIAGSTTLGDGVALAGQVGIVGHLKIGDGAQVAAQAGVSHDIPAGETWFGYPARPRTQVMRANAAMLKLPELIRRVRQLEGKVEAAGL